jgi:hypothetical protein
MPSVSQEQHNTMGAAKHSEAVREATGIPLKVATEFIAADKGGPFDRGDYHHEVHKKAKAPGKWHDKHSGHPSGA